MTILKIRFESRVTFPPQNLLIRYMNSRNMAGGRTNDI